MKSYNLLLFYLLTFFPSFGQAQTAEGGVNYQAQGLTMEEAYLSLDEAPYSGREFSLGSEAKLLFEGIKGYSLQEGMAYPRISMRVVERQEGGAVLLQYDNLLAAYEQSGVSPEQAATLSTNLTIGQPLRLGESYRWEVEISEGAGDGHIRLGYDFEVVEARPLPADDGERFQYETTGLEVAGVVLEIEGQPWPELDLPGGKTVDMVFSGVRGFGLREGMVHPGLAVRVTDINGNVVLEAADLFSDANGFPQEQAERLTSNLTIGAPMQVGQTYLWEVYIWDKTWPRRSAYAWLHFRVMGE